MRNVTAAADQSADIWEKFFWAWIGLAYVTVLVPALIVWLGDDVTVDTLRHVGWLVAIWLVWLTAFNVYFARIGRHRQQPLVGTVYMVVIFALWYALVTISPAFYLTLFGIYGQMFSVVPLRWGIGLALVLSALMALSQVEEGESFAVWSPAVLRTLLSAAAGILLALWIGAIINQSGERRRLIEELRQAQRELADAERTAGMLEERQRLAREIHDTLAQGFTSIIMHLEAAEQASADSGPGGADRLRHHLGFAQRAARDGLQQARRVVQDLRPIPLESSTLSEALARTIAAWGEETGIHTKLNVTGIVANLHPEIEVTLLRAVQEGLSNVRKHSHASVAVVTLSYLENVVLLDIQDNGVGMTQPSANGHLAGGFGLTAMRERVAQFGGAVTIECEPQEGTTLVVEIPLRTEDNE